MKICPFCIKPESEIIAENELALAFYDAFPVNPGHVLVIPKRHFPAFFEATEDEITAIYRLIHRVKAILDEKYHPDGYNIGVNVGAPAGQTVFHLHVHVIPRYTGDVENPWGGVRNFKQGMVEYR